MLTSSTDRPLRVHVVLSDDNRAWIIEKIGRRLVEHAAESGVEMSLSNGPRPDVHVNHWMSYAFANVRHTTPTTMAITHIDDACKLQLVKSELKNGVTVGICMSSAAVDTLVARGVPRESLTHVLPAHDFTVRPRRIVIGLTTRLYRDGRKREHLLVRLAENMRLDAFRFDIFGLGWDEVVPKLEAAGAEVRYVPGTDNYAADYAQILEALPYFDYYLYLGLDEGSLGTLDALAAGVRTIVTPQGFHLDLPNGITHPCVTAEDLLAVFRALIDERETRIAAVRDLSWREHARQHAAIWRAVAEGRTRAILGTTGDSRTMPLSPNASSKVVPPDPYFHLRALAPRRLRSALSWLPLLRPVRTWIKSRR